jgi:hypothetical protein
MKVLLLVITIGMLPTVIAHAQWEILNSNTTADLRGIHNVGGGVAWASGTNGTILHTENGGNVWHKCTIPPGAEKLDFRGIQAFSANTAIVMSSGNGDLSRLYRTMDGCHSWELIFTNPHKNGLWVALRMWTPTDGFLAGEPVDGFLYFAESTSYWNAFLDNEGDSGWKAAQGERVFAASNSVLSLAPFHKEDKQRGVWYATGGGSGSRIIHYNHSSIGDPETIQMTFSKIEGFPQTNSGGISSIYIHDGKKGVAVGGDYKNPEAQGGNSAYTLDTLSGGNWSISRSFPHGYRSAVAYDEQTKIWIAVGPNGTDISTDDGQNWRVLKPDLAHQEVPDADRNWNSLSLPFAVGPHGRIGKLNPQALALK